MSRSTGFTTFDSRTHSSSNAADSSNASTSPNASIDESPGIRVRVEIIGEGVALTGDQVEVDVRNDLSTGDSSTSDSSTGDSLAGGPLDREDSAVTSVSTRSSASSPTPTASATMLSEVDRDLVIAEAIDPDESATQLRALGDGFDAAELSDFRTSQTCRCFHAALGCRLAYGSTSVVRDVAQDRWGLDNVATFTAGDAACFVGGSNDASFVFFRGTDNLGDWLTNLRLLSTRRPYGRVHRGFLAAMQSLAPPVLRWLDRRGDRPIVVGGHSLGGAMAVLFAAEHHRRDIDAIYTFGQPAAGKGSFEDFINEQFFRYVRVVNDRDIVSRVPPTYSHAGRLLQLHPTLTETLSTGATELTAAESHQTGEDQTMSEDAFADLQIQLSVGRGGPMEPPLIQDPLIQDPGVPPIDGDVVTESAFTEGLFSSFTDHGIDRYVDRLRSRCETASN